MLKYFQTAQKKRVEIILVSFDRTERDMMSYISSFHEEKFAVNHKSVLAEKLVERFNIKNPPTLIVLQRDGTLITSEGVRDVQEYGAEVLFSWMEGFSPGPKSFIRKLLDKIRKLGKFLKNAPRHII